MPLDPRHPPRSKHWQRLTQRLALFTLVGAAFAAAVQPDKWQWP